MKNAYCILAHNEPNVLNTLVSLLDDETNDIYIHLDKKASCFNEKSITEAVKKSKITFIPRRNIGWGGINMIKTELELLSVAIENSHDYYHILSGVDLPLYSVKKVNKFLEKNKGQEFIGVTRNWADSDNVKIRYSKYYYLQDYIGKNKKIPLYYISRGFAKLQSRLNFIDRTKNYSTKFYGGPTWFSVTEEAAKWIVSKSDVIKRMFANTYCCDEIFSQTILMSSPFANNIYKYEYGDCYESCRRFVRFEAESPKTLDMEDYEQLINSNYLFARKFGTTTESQRQLIKEIKEKCME